MTALADLVLPQIVRQVRREIVQREFASRITS
jgi:hypothetical protein